jgi:outer membrane protein assembly factor BamB
LVVGGRIYYGCWDGYVYALDARDGRLVWKTQGAGAAASLPGVARYYSPADAAPARLGDQLWIADRMFRVTVLDPVSGAKLAERKDISSVAAAADERAVYLRGTDGHLRKVAAAGQELWSALAQTNVVPSAATERDGVVYSTSATGRVHALDAADGHQLWEYQATPGLYVFSDPVVHDGVVYVTGMDGSLTALRGR